MGNPQEGLKYIHVGGTNGKGSVSLIIANILSQAGYKTGRYTSPHLHSYCERFMIDSQPITPEELYRYLELIQECIKKMLFKGWPHPTEFEVLTAAAFLFFQEQKVDFAVLEVGMGGVYDSTNLITPLLSVITSVSYDHTQYLGETIEEIAWNKAGIIKPGRPVVTGLMENRALAVVRQQAESKGSPLWDHRSVQVRQISSRGMQGHTVLFSGGLAAEAALEYSLAGLHQLDNLATALTVVSLIQDEYNISAAAIRAALKDLHIPGRMQLLQEKPLVIADAAHNGEGAKALAKSLQAILPGRNKVMVIGMVDDKDVLSILQELGSHTQACVITRPEGPRGAKWERAARVTRELYPHLMVYQEPDIPQAISLGLGLLREDDYLLISGSFYVLRQAALYQF